MAKSALRLVAPTEILRTVAPTRRGNAELRTREHLTAGEVKVPNRCRQGQPIRSSGRDHDPSGIPARVAGGRAVRPALGPGGLAQASADRLRLTHPSGRFRKIFRRSVGSPVAGRGDEHGLLKLGKRLGLGIRAPSQAGRNVGGSPRPETHDAETAPAGWGARISRPPT